MHKLFHLITIICCLGITTVSNTAQSTNQYIPQGTFNDIPTLTSSDTTKCQSLFELLPPEAKLASIIFNRSESGEYIYIAYRGYFNDTSILLVQPIEDFMSNSSTEVYMIERRHYDIASNERIELIDQRVDEESVWLKFQLQNHKPSAICKSIVLEMTVSRNS